MHEMAIATDLFEQVSRTTREHGAVRVSRVELEIGILKLIVPEALQIAWQACIEDTELHEAALELVEIHPRARCRNCHAEFAPEIDTYTCPQCNIADAEILEGNDIILKSIDCEVPDTAQQEEMRT